MVNISSDVIKIVAIVAGLVIIPGIAYVVVEKSNEYTGEVGPKVLGNVSYPQGAGGKKHKNKSRKLRR
jgi:hypothetical protein